MSDGVPDTGREAAPGWDAIDGALEPIFGSQEPVHWEISSAVPDVGGIWGISAYRSARAWFYVTYGLSELWEKTSDDPAISGWGIELTMRVLADNSEPPLWPANLLERLGAYVYSTGSVFDPGHRFDPHSEITGGTPPTELTAVAFAQDPQLGTISTPNGSVTFVLAFGITRDEHERMKLSRTDLVLDEFRSANPLLITDPTRIGLSE